VKRLRIESIAAGGAGVARDSGRAIFVPRTAPGEVVEATVAARGGTLRATVLRVVEPGPGRVQPPCAYFEECGGCDLMHLSADAQRAAHQAIVADALQRTGGLTSLPPIVSHTVHPSVVEDDIPRAALGYRTRARFYARFDRGRLRVGFRAPDSHTITEVERCVVLVPELDTLLRSLPAILAGASGDGEVSVARGDGGRPVVDVSWRGDLPAAVWARVDEQIRDGVWAGARVWLDGATTPASFGDPRPVAEGVDGRPLVVAAGGFAQPSDDAGAVLARLAADLVRKSGDSLGSIVELFAGSGTLSILLAPLAARFVAVESQEESVRAARQNLEARGLDGKVVCADADAFAPGRADVVVLDPPRTGAKGAAERIAASASRAVVYVACEPTTLARDVAVLAAAGFTVTDIETVEIFPHTSHVETLVRMVRGAGKKDVA